MAQWSILFVALASASVAGAMAENPVGWARFFGPLSGACEVKYTTAASSTTTIGQVPVPATATATTPTSTASPPPPASSTPTPAAADSPPPGAAVDSPPPAAAVDSPPPGAAADSPPPAAAVDSPPPAAAVDSPPPAAAVDSPPPAAAVDSPPPAAPVDSPPPAAPVDSPPPAAPVDSPPPAAPVDSPPPAAPVDSPPPAAPVDSPPPAAPVDSPPPAAPARRMAQEVTASSAEIAKVLVCTDSFTGQKIAFPVSGTTSKTSSFQVNAVTTVSASTGGSASSAYSKLGYNVSASAETADVFALMKAGNISTAEGILKTDLMFIASSVVITQAVLPLVNASSACTTTAQLHSSLASWISSQDAFNPKNASHVSAAINSFASAPCSLPDAAMTANNTDITAVATLLATIATNMPTITPLYDVAAMAKFASFLSTLNLDALKNKTVGDVITAVDAAAIVPAQITATLGISGYTAVDTSVVVMATGPLSGAMLQYMPFTSLSAKNLTATSSSGGVTVAGATSGYYAVAAGAVDTFLTVDSAKPVKTLIPFSAVTGFTGANAKLVLTPLSSLVLLSYTSSQGEGMAPAVPVAADWKKAYESLVGTLPDADYLARDYTAGSGVALAVMSSDILFPAIPTLGGVFITNALNGTKMDDVAPSLMKEIQGVKAAQHANATLVVSVLKKVYTDFKNGTTSSRRQLLQAELDGILASISAAIADSNSIINEAIAVAASSIASGNPPPASSFTTIVQVAQVQTTSLAAAITKVAALVKAGDLTAAAAAATEVQTQFTGAALRTAVAAASVNVDAIQAAVYGTPEVGTTDKKRLAIGLGVGLGVGVPVLVALIVGVVWYVKSRRSAQSTAPAPAAESLHYP